MSFPDAGDPWAPGLSGVRTLGDGCGPREAPTCSPLIVLNGAAAAKLVERADFTKRVAVDQGLTTAIRVLETCLPPDWEGKPDPFGGAPQPLIREFFRLMQTNQLLDAWRWGHDKNDTGTGRGAAGGYVDSEESTK